MSRAAIKTSQKSCIIKTHDSKFALLFVGLCYGSAGATTRHVLEVHSSTVTAIPMLPEGTSDYY